MTLGSLFAGIGGFELAATWAGITPVWSNEIDPFCCKVLRKNFKHEIIERDIREIGEHYLKPVDIISGGFPCQPFSRNGKREGQNDDRNLWPDMLRVINELRPFYVIAENVPGIQDNGFLNEILDDLEASSYEIWEPMEIPACAVGAEHERNRVWIVANSSIFGMERVRAKGKQISRPLDKKILPLRNSNGKWKIEPDVRRTNDGVSNRVDRLKALGNAIVPQVAYEIFKAIK